MPPDMAKAGPRRHGKPAPSSTPTSATINPRVAGSALTVAAIAYAPAGRRTCWLSVVERCPHCGGAHMHRGDTEHPASDLRAAGCGRGYYLVTGDPSGVGSRDSRLGRYSEACAAAWTGITERARAAAELGGTPVGAIENLELLRVTLHREIDHLLDAEADCRGHLLTIPPPRDENSR